MNHSPVALRSMQWTDIDQLTVLERDLFPDDAWNAQSWWSELAHRPRRRYAVLEDADGLAGYAGLDCGGEVADVMTIAVAPGVRGSGHGRRLLDWLMKQAREGRAQAVMLEVRADNHPAQKLYRSAGFEQIHLRRGYYQPGGVDALIMRAQLTDETDDHAQH